MRRFAASAAASLIFLWPMFSRAEMPVAACRVGQNQTIAILVRHAERNGGEKLVESGWERARTLRDIIFKQFGGVDAVLHTTVERTEETVRPTRQKAGDIPAFSRDAHDYAGFADLIREAHAKGKKRTVLLYAGHSNTIKPILDQLNARQVEQNAGRWFSCNPELCHWDYHNLWTVTLCGNAGPEIRKTEYGARTMGP